MSAQDSQSLEIEFGRSADGFPVARVGDVAFAMLPATDNRFVLANGWMLHTPPCEWRRSDFYGHAGEIADEDAFRAKVMEHAEHRRERAAFGRIETISHVSTPWGVSQRATIYSDGVESHSTAGHGGFQLSAERNRRGHPTLRARGGWYEEDAAWAIVAITFPGLFTSFERRCAERTVKDYWPGAFEAIFGVTLQPGESYERDRRAFQKAHASDWIVTSAIISDHQNGAVECIASLGREHGPHAGVRRFLVPSSEYEVGRFGFVIDPVRHAVYDGPSSFIGWRRGEAS